MVGGSSARFIRSYFQRVIDWRKATKSGTGLKRAMLLGDARTRDERGLDIEKTEHSVLDGERIRDERAANRRGSRMEAFGRGHEKQRGRVFILHLMSRMKTRPLCFHGRLHHFSGKSETLLPIGWLHYADHQVAPLR